MQAKDWTYEKLVCYSARELEQLIDNLEVMQRRAEKRSTARTAAIKRTRFVLYACGNLLPPEKTAARCNPFTGEEIKIQEKQQLSQQQLLTIVQLQRFIASRVSSKNKHALLAVLNQTSISNQQRRAVNDLQKLFDTQAANSAAIFSAA